jgi:hypothetical protein
VVLGEPGFAGAVQLVGGGGRREQLWALGKGSGLGDAAHVTPHYWTAAEMLLLQLDMLACLDESGVEPVLRVGLGLPESWLEQPMSVKGLPTRLGRVDWEWSDQRMTVRLRGFQGAVELGPTFQTRLAGARTPVCGCAINEGAGDGRSRRSRAGSFSR